MDSNEENEAYVNLINQIPVPDNVRDSSLPGLQNEQTSESTLNSDCMKQDSQKLNSAIWTTRATSMLLKLYEEKLEMLQTPKKKTKIWIAISENLKECDIDMTPDQVRWKINALTKKYKHSIDIEKHEKFKYFKEMNNIYKKYNVDCDAYTITESLSKNNSKYDSINDCTPRKSLPETRAITEMRKARLANKIYCDRFQGKIKLEKQWLQYLHRQEEQRKSRDRIFERKLKAREEKFETMKRELDLKESLEYRKLLLMEKEQEDFLLVEREKLELLKQMFQ